MATANISVASCPFIGMKYSPSKHINLVLEKHGLSVSQLNLWKCKYAANRSAEHTSQLRGKSRNMMCGESGRTIYVITHYSYSIQTTWKDTWGDMHAHHQKSQLWFLKAQVWQNHRHSEHRNEKNTLDPRSKQTQNKYATDESSTSGIFSLSLNVIA